MLSVEQTETYAPSWMFQYRRCLKEPCHKLLMLFWHPENPWFYEISQIIVQFCFKTGSS